MMLKSCQIVFLIDISAPLNSYQEEEQLKNYESSITLSCLRLLTEFGALCLNGAEGLRWGFKCYDSLVFKPGTTQKSFLDFNSESFDKFANELTQKHEKKRISYINGEKETSPISRGHSHAYILNKALQEILLDYDWDRPDISSPVKCMRRKHGDARVTRSTYRDIDDSGPFNIIVSFNDVPKNIDDLSKFSKSDGKRTNDLLLNILEKSTQLGLKEDKNIKLHLVNCGSICVEKDFIKKLNVALSPINGNIHELRNIVSLVPSSKIYKNEEIYKDRGLFVNQLQSKYNLNCFGISNLFYKTNQKPAARNRSSQKGPTLLWEDENGFFFMNVQLQVLSIKGSSIQQWDTLTVCAVIKDEAMTLLGLAMTDSNLFICHSSKDANFKIMLEMLYAQKVVVILRHKCGGLGVLCPWIGGTAYLALFSSSSFVTPPIHINEKFVKANCMDETYSKVISSLIKKTLKGIDAVPDSVLASTSQQLWDHCLKTWLPTSDANSAEFQLCLRSKKSEQRKMMAERMQKKYRPQIPKALSGSNLPPQILVDITQPTSAAAMPNGGLCVENGRKRSRLVTRGQQIAKRGQMLKAQKKAMLLEAEATELLEANKKKVETAEKRSKILTRLSAKVMEDIGDSVSTEVLLDNLKIMRDAANYCNDNTASTESDYLLLLIQAIIGVVLNFIKSTCPKFLVNSQLKETLSDGIFLTSAEVKSSYDGKEQIRQLKLQVLLHLEVLWLSGYADSLADDSHGSKEKNWHIEEIIKHLRAISLYHDAASMTYFLEHSVLPNYENTMGEVLVEIYDELNQPLASSIVCYSQRDPSPRRVSPDIIKKRPQPKPVEEPRKHHRSRMPLTRQANQRQIVINLPRRSKKHRSSTSNSNHTSQMKSVKRSLFEMDNDSNLVPLTRSNTEPTPKRLLKTPNKIDRKLPVFKTPNSKCGSAKKSLLLSPDDCTPTKCDDGSASKRRRIFAPETPAKQLGKNIFNANRLRKSTGQTTIIESPDTKKNHQKVSNGHTNNYRHFTLRKSFYAENCTSRNFERGKRSVLVSRLSSGLNRRSSMPSTLSSHRHIFSNFMQPVDQQTKELAESTNIKKLTFS